MYNYFDKFKISSDKEELSTVVKDIEDGIVFRGTNSWILIFAILVASLGLNINSTAVIIGAMLISPLMGPIMGIGLSMGIHDIPLLKRASSNYLIATGVALTTSTLFFLLSPLNGAHSEILARTSPTIYDVLIAFFGGFAGIVATASKHKGNVIPGVAIATALMPPLCTAGYGLATLQFNFFFGAFYLYIINSVFIALATFLIVRFLHFPFKHLKNQNADKLARRIVWVVVIVTLLPSIYFGYDMVRQSRFTDSANQFINNEAHFPNDYLLSKKIDAKKRNIVLVFGGKQISLQETENLKNRMKIYNIESATLEIKQGFAYLAENKKNESNDQLLHLTEELEEKSKDQQFLQLQIDSINNQQAIGTQVYAEIKAQYPGLKNAIIQPSVILSDSSEIGSQFLVLLTFSQRLNIEEQTKIEKWLKVRLKQKEIKLIFH